MIRPIIRPIRKGESYENAVGFTMQAKTDGAIFHCDFVSEESLVQVLSALGWKCRERRRGDDADRRPDVLG